MTNFSTSSRFRKVYFEAEQPNGDIVEGEWLDPFAGNLEVSSLGYGPIGYKLEWAGNGELRHIKKPIDIDDNPCIVRGYD